MKTQSRHIAPYVIAAAVSALLIFLAYVMFYVPKMNDTKALEGQTAAVNASNAALAVKVAVIGENARNVGSLDERVNEFNASFPPGSSQRDLMDAVAGAAAESGVLLTTMNPTVPSVAMLPGETAEGSDPAVAEAEAAAVAADAAAADPALASVQASAPDVVQEGSGVAVVQLTIGAKGSPEALRDFMEKLESMPRPILVKTFNFTGQGEETALGMTAETFFVAPLANPAAAAEEAPAEEAAEDQAEVTDEATEAPADTE